VSKLGRGHAGRDDRRADIVSSGAGIGARPPRSLEAQCGRSADRSGAARCVVPNMPAFGRRPRPHRGASRCGAGSCDDHLPPPPFPVRLAGPRMPRVLTGHRCPAAIRPPSRGVAVAGPSLCYARRRCSRPPGARRSRRRRRARCRGCPAEARSRPAACDPLDAPVMRRSVFQSSHRVAPFRVRWTVDGAIHGTGGSPISRRICPILQKCVEGIALIPKNVR